MDFQEKYTKQIAWLLEGDPSIRYQTLRDLVNAHGNDIDKERQRVLKEGWGRRVMDLQEDNGTWSHALYSPKWTSTFYTLLLLKRFGAPNDKHTEKACRILLDNGFYSKDGGINYWKTRKQGECCVTGMLLSMLCHFHIDDDRIHRRVLLSSVTASQGDRSRDRPVEGVEVPATGGREDRKHAETRQPQSGRKAVLVHETPTSIK